MARYSLSTPWRLLRTAVCLYLLFVAFLAALQRKLLYYPTRVTEQQDLAQAERLGLRPWRGKAGGIIGWQSKTERPRDAHKLLIVHGNAGSAIHRVDYLAGFESVATPQQWDARVLEYPGYGSRSGSPSRASFLAAAEEALAIWDESQPGPVYILGESIGSGVACDLAKAQPEKVAGLVLVTPFARLADVAQRHFPILPVRLILLDRWDNIAALSGYTGRSALLIAGEDEVVSTAQGDKLFERITGEKKRWFFPGATHNDIEIQSCGWASEVAQFLLEPKRR